MTFYMCNQILQFPQNPYFCPMLIIDKILVSDAIKDTYFACNLQACKGDCCVAGDAGAPLEEEEISILEDVLDEVIPYMSQEGKEVVDWTGVFEYDTEGEYVTPLVKDEECAFVYVKDGISFCAIEKAYLEGKIKFQKPVSCHLYPIRIKKVGETEAVNYDIWSVCAPALIKGKTVGVPLYQYLKVPLIRKFGSKWYAKLVVALEKEQM